MAEFIHLTLQCSDIFVAFVDPKSLPAFQTFYLFFHAAIGFDHGLDAMLFLAHGVFGFTHFFLEQICFFAQQGNTQQLFNDGTLIIGLEAEERFGVGVQCQDVLEHIVGHAQGAFYGQLCFSRVTLAVVVFGLLYFVVNAEFKYIGLASTLDTIALTVHIEIQTHDHVLGIGLVYEIVFAYVGQGLSIQGITQSIDYGGFAGAVARTIATKV